MLLIRPAQHPQAGDRTWQTELPPQAAVCRPEAQVVVYSSLFTACECLSALHRQGVCVCVHLFFITSKRWSSYQACSVQSGLMMPLLLQAVRATSLESWPSENAKYADFGPVRRPNFRLQETALARTRACYSQALAGFELQNCGVRWMALASRHEERKMADDILLWEKIRLQPLCGT